MIKIIEEELDQAENPALGTIELRICRVIRTGYGGTCAAVRQAPSGATVNERRKRSVMGGLSVSYAYFFIHGVLRLIVPAALHQRSRLSRSKLSRYYRTVPKTHRPTLPFNSDIDLRVYDCARVILCLS